jgi:hypothetical protein
VFFQLGAFDDNKPCIYQTRPRSECEAQVKNFQGALYKKFINYAEAESFANGGSSTGSATPVSPATTAVETASPSPTKKRALSSDAENVEEWDVVFCDGACKGNGQEGSVAGIGVWWGGDDNRYVRLRMHSLLDLESREISPNVALETRRIIVQSLS